MTDEAAPVETRFYGVGVSGGIARAKILVVSDDFEEIARYPITATEITTAANA